MQFNSIQILRGIAALLVVVHHVKNYVGNSSGFFSSIPQVLGNGAVLFFAISGFLMAYLIDIGYKNFLTKRLARIYPTFLLVTILTTFFNVMTFGSTGNPELLRSITLLPFGIKNYTLYGIEWTLIFEVFFYCICSVFTMGNAKKYFPHFLGLWLLIVLIAEFKYKLSPNAYPALDTIFFQIYNMFFILGGLTYYIHKNKHSIINKISYVLAISLFIYLFSWSYLLKYIWFAKFQLHILALCCAATILGSLYIENKRIGWLHQMMHKLGDSSYSLYLIHYPLIVILFSLYKDNVGEINTEISIVILVLCILFGYFFGNIDIKLHETVKKYI